jgi:ferredoxin-NADP reductase
MARTAIPGRLTWLLATVTANLPDNERASTISLHVPGWPGHLAGQHVDIRLTAADGYQTERSYSIASAPNGETIELTVERIDDGEVSPYLTDELRQGDQIEVRGPIGGYFAWTPSHGGPLALIGGGSGIVPLMAMLRVRATEAPTTPTVLLASFRSPADVIYRDELSHRAAEPGVRIATTYTRVAPPNWTGYRRRVDAPMLAEIIPAPEERPHNYVCGPTPFVEQVAALLVELGHEPARIRTERFGPTGG